jgi:hypothetical protein
LTAWVDDLNRDILGRYDTRLCGGFAEPFYRAPVNARFAEIRFTRDFERSALHELAHWCVAGSERRRQDDYGYWYAPDGRDHEQQQLFFQVEIKPQAIEKHFCTALGLPFDVSADNLASPQVSGLDAFRCAVDAQYCAYSGNGLPGRAAAIADWLQQWRHNREVKTL